MLVVYHNEWELIKDQEIWECSVAAQLFYYLKCDTMLKNFDVDLEYNKMLRDGQTFTKGELFKRINAPDENGENPIVRPDIIIHNRGPHGRRFLWIEVKMEWGRSPKDDIRKILAVTKPYDSKAEYVTGYDYGLSVVLGLENISYFWTENGIGKERESEKTPYGAHQ
jgi:hypothetical protein